jgi:hypothetical protein
LTCSPWAWEAVLRPLSASVIPCPSDFWVTKWCCAAGFSIELQRNRSRTYMNTCKNGATSSVYIQKAENQNHKAEKQVVLLNIRTWKAQSCMWSNCQSKDCSFPLITYRGSTLGLTRYAVFIWSRGERYVGYARSKWGPWSVQYLACFRGHTRLRVVCLLCTLKKIV